jgi:hypothetical protein
MVVINLSTNGGSLDATDTFLQAMRNCEARIVVKASGGVHSAGSVILLEADEFFLSDNFNCLIHNGSCGAGGDFNKFVAHAKYTQEYMERVMRTTYAGFLTDDEITALIDGKDFWLNAEQFVERWEARNALLQAKMESERGEMMAALAEKLGVVKGAAEKPAKPRKKPKKEGTVTSDV